MTEALEVTKAGFFAFHLNYWERFFAESDR